MQDFDQIAGQAPGIMSKRIYLLQQLKQAGEPITISINGWGHLAIKDDVSFEMFLGLVERLETVEMVQEGLLELKDGKGLSLEEAKAMTRKKHGLPV